MIPFDNIRAFAYDTSSKCRHQTEYKIYSTFNSISGFIWNIKIAGKRHLNIFFQVIWNMCKFNKYTGCQNSETSLYVINYKYRIVCIFNFCCSIIILYLFHRSIQDFVLSKTNINAIIFDRFLDTCWNVPSILILL